MNYVKSFDLFGVPAKQIPSITGKGTPTTTTEGAVGCLYMDEDTGCLYKCTSAANGVYNWLNVSSVVTDEQLAIAVENYIAENPVNDPTDEQVAAAVEDYMVEHPVTPVELDTTLSIEGKAADAKAVGEALNSKSSSNMINLEKYGIVAADYEAPFTTEMYEVAYNNGLGIQKAIDDAKAAGQREIVIPAGNYPLCYHANAKNEYNPIINTNGVNLYGYGVKLYVIYDEDGINPYYSWTDAEITENGGVQNHYMLMGTVINADRNVEGFEIVGEREHRKHENTKYREFSTGITIDTWACSNLIKNCKVHRFSGDGIGNGSAFENVYVSGEVTCPSGKMVNGVIESSTESWLSPRMGIGYSVDMTKPIQIASTGYQYFLWTKKQLTIHCFTREENYITSIRANQGDPFILPSDTFYVYVEMYAGGELTEDSTGTVNFRFGNMYYYGTVIDSCEVFLNQRGGMSNLPSGCVVKNCTIHHNGGAYGDMVAFFDGTQFGIDIEDWYINNITIDNCKFYNQIHDVLFRCNKITIKNCELHNSFRSLNYAVDVWLENSKFYGNIIFADSASFGNKMAMNCTFAKDYPAELKVLDQAPTRASIDPENSFLINFYDAAGNKLFDLDLSQLGKVPGENIISDALLFDLDATKFTADALTLNDNTGNASAVLNNADNIVDSGVCLGTGFNPPIRCTWVNAPTFAEEISFEAMCFGVPNILMANNSNVEFMGGAHQAGHAIVTEHTINMEGVPSLGSNIPYINTSGSSANAKGDTGRMITLEDGSTQLGNDYRVSELNSSKYWHIVLNVYKDGTMVYYINGFPYTTNPTTTDFTSWDFSSLLEGFYFLNGATNTSYILKTARMYNRTLTKEEITNNLIFEANKLEI